MGASSVLTTSFLLLSVSGVHMRCQGHQRPRMLIAHPYISAPIGSHTYPYRTYPNNSSCEWLISADTGYVVRLTLLLVDLQDSDTSDCPFNRLTIYDGNSRNSRQLGAFCSQRLSNGRSVDSSLRWLYVELKADEADSKGRFLFTYEAVQPQLSTTLGFEAHTCQPSDVDIHAIPGVNYIIMSLNNRHGHQTVSRCEWRIQTDLGYVISLRAELAEGQSPPAQVCDSLQVFDGLTEYADPIHADCFGWSFPMYSSGQFMYVRLTQQLTSMTDFRLWVEAVFASMATVKRSTDDYDGEGSDGYKDEKSRTRMLGIVYGCSALGFAVVVAITVVVIARHIKKARADAASGRATTIAMTTITPCRLASSTAAPPSVHAGSCCLPQHRNSYFAQQNSAVILFPPSAMMSLSRGCQGNDPVMRPTHLSDLPPPYASLAVKPATPVQPSVLFLSSPGEPPPAYSCAMLTSHPPASSPPKSPSQSSWPSRL